MITDRVECAGMYAGLGERISLGLALLNEEQVRTSAPGRYEVQEDLIFFVTDVYRSRPIEISRFESHRKYLDIQYVVSGREWISYGPVEGLTVETPYVPDKDVEFYASVESASRVLMQAGTFAIFFPHDAHMPGLMVERPEEVRKIVVKIRLE